MTNIIKCKPCIPYFMPSLIARLNLPNEWNQYPQTAKTSHLQNEIGIDALLDTVINEYSLPEGTRADGRLTKEQWIALVRELDNGDSE